MDYLKEEEVIKKIKEKRELAGINYQVVRESVLKYCKKNNIEINELRKEELPYIVKFVRAELRNLSGRFTREMSKGNSKNNSTPENMLKSHSSSKERTFYPELLKIIKELNVKSILDLGCGINPLALARPNLSYYATDINEDFLRIVDAFFKSNNLPGETIVHDLRKGVSGLPEADLILIFKVFDVLEKKGHKLAESIISNLRGKYALISFSTKTLSGKPMNHPQRGWIERLLSRLSLNFKKIDFPGEIFYLVYLNSSSKK